MRAQFGSPLAPNSEMRSTYPPLEGEGRLAYSEAECETGWGDLSASEMPMVSTLIRRAAAKRLRANTTPHERALWRALKELPVDGTHFRRQAPIGPYVVDFLCPAKRLIIELDGGHHNEDETTKRDGKRQLWLEREGYRVIRFWNSEITGDLTAVIERIYVELYGSRDAEVSPLKHRRRR